MSAVAASSMVRLPIWRARVVMCALLAAFAVLGCPLGVPAGARYALSAGEGRGALQPRAGDSRYARPHPRPQWGGARRVHAGAVGVGDPRGRRGDRRAAPEARRAARRGCARTAEESRRYLARLRLPQAPDPAGAGRAGGTPRRAGHLPAPRVPALLPRRRAHRAPGRVHGRGRIGAGGHRARAPDEPGRRPRQPARDQGPPRPRGGGHRSRSARRRTAKTCSCRSTARSRASPTAR